MAIASTYEPIATYTATGTISNYTFSSIPSTYTDLKLVISPFISTGIDDVRIRFNGDTATNYSAVLVRGSGSATVTALDNNATYIGWLDYANSSTTTDMSLSIIDIMSYTNTSVYKTVLSKHGLPAAFVTATVGLWRSTAAINSITIIGGAASITSGSTFTLYGIKAA
jgi:hypothetical protein